MAAQGKNKWLREKDDQRWEARVGRDNCQEKISEFEIKDKGKAENTGRNFKDTLHDLSGKYNDNNFSNIQNSRAGSGIDKSNKVRLDHEEPNWLNIEERKRRRCESNYVASTSIDMELGSKSTRDTTMRTTLSNIDCAVLTTTEIVKSAAQTSQPQ